MFLIPFFVFLACLFVVYALYLFTSRKSDARRKLLNERLAEAIRTSAQSSDVEVQLAREELLSEIPWVNRSLIKFELSASIKRLTNLGYLTCDAPANDKRRREIRLTDRGAEAMAATSVLDRERVRGMLKKLKPADRRAALNGLALLARAARELGAEEAV